MRTIRLALLASFAGAGGAAAQTPLAPPEETPVEDVASEEPEAREEETPPPTDSSSTEPAAPTEDDAIPGRGIGIGAGWVFPTDILVPNAASARFRLASGLTFEAAVTLALNTTSSETTIGGTTDESGSSGVDVVGAVLVRYPLATRGRFQFVGVGGLGVGLSTDSNEDDGMETSSSRVLFAGASWGIGIDWFVRRNWSISLTAQNPILQWSSTTQEAGSLETTDSSLLIGAIWDPTVSAMVHLYY